MPNIAAVLKSEISRLARKEIREQTQTLQRQSAQYRRDIAALKRQVTLLERKASLLEKTVLSEKPSRSGDVDVERVRFSPKGLRSQRKRLGMSAGDYGKLVGVSSQTIYNWEQGSSKPRKQQLAELAALRGIGKKEALARLEQAKK
jgi:DNA-binding transcriptional regulator YiaG